MSSAPDVDTARQRSFKSVVGDNVAGVVDGRFAFGVRDAVFTVGWLLIVLKGDAPCAGDGAGEWDVDNDAPAEATDRLEGGDT